MSKERGKLSLQDQVSLLVTSLTHESMTVRATALKELRSLLSDHREWTLGLLAEGSAAGAGSGTEASAGQGGGAALLSRLMSALLSCCDPEANNVAGQQAQQAAAQCLGMLGAVDPARLTIEVPPPAPRYT
jgi:serine/threonine-protein kinase ATR